VDSGSTSCLSCGLHLTTSDLPTEIGWVPSTQQFQLGRRVGSTALDAAIFTFTLGIGWIVWQLLILKKAQSPAKQLLNLRVEDVATNDQASLGKYLLRLAAFPICLGSLVFLVFLGLSLTGRSVSQAWLTAFSQVVTIAFLLADYGAIFTSNGSRLTDRVLRTKVSFGTNNLI
jgi:hypothetical protein